MRTGAVVIAIWRVWKASTAAGGRGEGKGLSADVRLVRGVGMVAKLRIKRR